jgi:hypothetical protein
MKKSPDLRDSLENGRKSLPATYLIRVHIQKLQGTQKPQPLKNQHPSEEMGMWIKQGLLKGRGTNGQ